MDGLYKWFSYSTKERWTGKFWTDGKPIYKKTLFGKTPSVSNQWNAVFNVTDLNIDILILLNGVITGVGGSGLEQTNVPNELFATLLNYPSIGMIGIITQWANYDISLNIEYTKTTDSAGTIPPFSN